MSTATRVAPYLTFRDGQLFDDDGYLYCADHFTTDVNAVEAYLITHDLHATIVVVDATESAA